MAQSVGRERLGDILTILIGCLVAIGGCVSDEVGDGSKVSTYQKRLAGSGPQQRLDAQEPPSFDPLRMLKPVETRRRRSRACRWLWTRIPARRPRH